MKKLLLLPILSLCAINVQAGSTNAVPTSYYGGYPSEYAANNQAGTLQPSRSGYKVYVDSSQRPERVYTRTYPAAYGYAEATPQAAPVPKSVYKVEEPKAIKKYYGVLRLGYGATHGWNSPFKTPRSVIINGAAGMYLPNQFRADIDLAYHIKDSLYKTETGKNFDYSQYDLSVNGYYDFNLSQTVKPFVGLGLGLTNSKVSGATNGALKISDDETNLAFSVSGGLDYYLTNNIALEALLRARYILCDGDLYNIEGLLGVRYDF